MVDIFLFIFIFFTCLKKTKQWCFSTTKERTAYHSPLRCWSTGGGLSCAARKEQSFWKVAEFIPPYGVLRQNVFFCSLLCFSAA